MSNLYTGSLSLKQGVSKTEGDVVFFNKASAKLGNVWLPEEREKMVAKAIAFAKANKLKLNVSGKKVGLGNYHTPAQLEKLLKSYEIECFEGFRGSVYMALIGEPQGEAEKAKTIKKGELAKGAITF